MKTTTSWSKFSLLGLLLTPLLLGVASLQNPDNFLRSEEKPKVLDKEALKREVTDTLGLVESLAAELKYADLSATAEVWESGPRDFRLKSGVVADCRESAKLMGQALDLEAGGDPALVEPAKGLRAKARKQIVDLHKNVTESFLRDLRNWLMVSEGELRHTRERAQRATAVPAASTSTAKAASKNKQEKAQK